MEATPAATNPPRNMKGGPQNSQHSKDLDEPLRDFVARNRQAAVNAACRYRRLSADLIRERTGDGHKRAIAAGIKFGRKRKLSDYQRAEAIKRRDAGETLGAIAKSYGVDISMISRL